MLNLYDYIIDYSVYRFGVCSTTFKIENNNKFIRDWFGIEDESKIKCAGVYMIGDFYIGKSNNMRKRLLQHCQKTIKDTHYNKGLSYALHDVFLRGLPITFRILSYNTKMELFFIKKYTDSLNLTNIATDYFATTKIIK